MKTAERILLTSLEMFNQQGETNITSVEIALELDISPGNLYYHFKGKDSIVTSLFGLYQRQMTKILNAPEQEQLDLEEFFYYLLLIFKTSHDFRFLYRNPAEIAEKYPQIAKGFRRIIASKEKVFGDSMEAFRKNELFFGTQLQCSQIVELIGLIGTQTPNYNLLKGNDINDGAYIHQSLATILFALSPYINMNEVQFKELYETITNQQLA